MPLDFTPTSRGFAKAQFTDRSGTQCSIQMSSLATEFAIWFGPDEADPKVMIDGQGWLNVQLPKDVVLTTRMHLTQAHVRRLLPHLTHFARTGELGTLACEEHDHAIDHPDRLFNCCTNGAEPDWAQFVALEIGGCIDTNRDEDTDETCTQGGVPAQSAEFFTVYGRRADGEAEAITDAVDPVRLLSAAAALSAKSGLYCFVSPTLV